jgi:hypothetical protein
MCRMPTSQLPRAAVAPRPSVGPRAAIGRRAEADALLRELAYVYRLTERVREEILPGGGTIRSAVAV